MHLMRTMLFSFVGFLTQLSRRSLSIMIAALCFSRAVSSASSASSASFSSLTSSRAILSSPAVRLRHTSQPLKPLPLQQASRRSIQTMLRAGRRLSQQNQLNQQNRLNQLSQLCQINQRTLRSKYQNHGKYMQPSFLSFGSFGAFGSFGSFVSSRPMMGYVPPSLSSFMSSSVSYDVRGCRRRRVKSHSGRSGRSSHSSQLSFVASLSSTSSEVLSASCVPSVSSTPSTHSAHIFESEANGVNGMVESASTVESTANESDKVKVNAKVNVKVKARFIPEQEWRGMAARHADRIHQLLAPGLLPPNQPNDANHPNPSPEESISKSAAQNKLKQSRHKTNAKRKNDTKDNNIRNQESKSSTMLKMPPIMGLNPHHPIYNFLIEYYGLKGSKGVRRLMRWCPPPYYHNYHNHRQKDDIETIENGVHDVDDVEHVISLEVPFSLLDSMVSDKETRESRVVRAEKEVKEVREIEESSNLWQVEEVSGVFLENATEEDVIRGLLHLRGATFISDASNNSNDSNNGENGENGVQGKKGILYSPSLYLAAKDPGILFHPLDHVDPSDQVDHSARVHNTRKQNESNEEKEENSKNFTLLPEDDVPHVPRNNHNEHTEHDANKLSTPHMRHTPPELPKPHKPHKAAAAFLWYRTLLKNTLRAEPVLFCHGLHEWAMLYHPNKHTSPPPSGKYQSHLPRRVSQSTINAQVERKGVRCTHVDALRFFAEEARGWNWYGYMGTDNTDNKEGSSCNELDIGNQGGCKGDSNNMNSVEGMEGVSSKPPSSANIPLNRSSQLTLEQPACLHANMDLFKMALRLQPFISSDVLVDCLTVAILARTLDVEASPYDVRGYAGLDWDELLKLVDLGDLENAVGLDDSEMPELLQDSSAQSIPATQLTPAAQSAPLPTNNLGVVPIETELGRKLYQKRQLEIMKRGQTVRTALLGSYDEFLEGVFRVERDVCVDGVD